MSKEYPLFPSLPEDGQKEAQLLIDSFKAKIKKEIDNLLGNLYCDVVCHIESDSWTNFRNSMMDGFKDYNNRHIQGAYDFKKIREQIYKDFRGEIVADLNQDLVKEVEELKEESAKHLKWYHDSMSRRY